jgi:hypothetical protein
MCLCAWPPKRATLQYYEAYLSFPDNPGLVSRSVHRQTIAALQSVQARKTAGVLKPAPIVLPTTLENSYSGYASLKTFATECSKLTTANPTL